MERKKVFESVNDSLDEQNVVDKNNWEKYLKEKQDPIFNDENRFTTASDGTEVDLLDYLVIQQNTHLPTKELAQLVAKAEYLRTSYQRVMKLRDLALGYSTFTSLSLPYTEEIVELLGRYYNENDIIQILRERYNVTLRRSHIKDVYAKFLNTIEALRKAHQTDFKSVRLSHKKSRLEELSLLYIDRKNRYNQGKSREDYKLLLATIDMIRREVDGDRLNIDINATVNVTSQVNIHLRKQLLSDLSLLDIIVARVASKANIPPTYLIERLRSSYYAKFTGFDTPDTSIYEDEVPYPNPTVYDFDKLKALHEGRQQIEKTPVVLNVDPNVSKLRDMLREKTKYTRSS